MKMKHSTKGFTLVEIMIVVVIIGLLAAMAIPAFQKVRRSSRAKALMNDARQLGSAAQQYFMETGATEVAFDFAPGANGNMVTGQLTTWVTKMNPQTVAGNDKNIEAATNGVFNLRMPGAFGGTDVSFDAEGKMNALVSVVD